MDLESQFQPKNPPKNLRSRENHFCVLMIFTIGVCVNSYNVLSISPGCGEMKKKPWGERHTRMYLHRRVFYPWGRKGKGERRRTAHLRANLQ
jgi:hypothetical protein